MREGTGLRGSFKEKGLPSPAVVCFFQVKNCGIFLICRWQKSRGFFSSSVGPLKLHGGGFQDRELKIQVVD